MTSRDGAGKLRSEKEENGKSRWGRYDGACNGEGRDRMTIAHEIGHYFTLCFCGFKLERNFGGGKIITFRDPEWQAKCFAGELMVPAHRVKGMTVDKIAEKCGVSFAAASVQHKHLKKG